MSGVLNKIWTALRGGVREMGDAIVDSNGIRIFEQEIIDAKDSIQQAKTNLTEVMARKMQAERKVSKLVEEIRNHEGYAGKALDNNDEALALEVAGKIATMEAEKASRMRSFGA